MIFKENLMSNIRTILSPIFMLVHGYGTKYKEQGVCRGVTRWMAGALVPTLGFYKKGGWGGQQN